MSDKRLGTGRLVADDFATLAVDIIPESGPWMRLVPAGRFTARDGRAFNVGSQADMRDIVQRSLRWHAETDMMVDYDHQSVFGVKEGVGGTARAAGWVKALEVRADGIYGRIEWTAAAAAAIKGGEYRYLSPVLPRRKSDGRVAMILNVALTNSPALDLEAVAASAALSDLPALIEGKPMNKIAETLGLAADAAEGDIIAVLETLKAGKPDPAQFVPISAFQQAVAEANKLRQGITEADAKRHVEAHIASGHLAPFMRNWAVELCMVNKPAFDSFAAAIGPSVVKIVTPQFDHRAAPPSRRGGANSNLDETELAVCSQLGLSSEEFSKAKPADMEV